MAMSRIIVYKDEIQKELYKHLFEGLGFQYGD